MKFECGDLERALAISDLMPEAREHLKYCATCRREYRIWNEISLAAREFREEWDSPTLWPKIQTALAAEPKPRPAFVWWKHWQTVAVAASVVLGSLLGLYLWQRTAVPGAAAPVVSQATAVSRDRDFLTDQALQDVEKTEAAYRKSIENLSRLAQPELAKASSPVAVNCRDKLLMLDAAISETRANLAENRFNVRLQTDLASLYREKQEALRELLTHDQKN